MQESSKRYSAQRTKQGIALLTWQFIALLDTGLRRYDAVFINEFPATNHATKRAP
jgi:hypothetical protein